MATSERRGTGTGRTSGTRRGPGLRLSLGLDDVAWDRFLHTVPGGHYTQTSSWGRFRSGFGWHAVRVVVRDRTGIVGGAQLLVRSVGPFGAIGYLHRGPVVAPRSPHALALTLEGVERLCRRHRVRYLALRPATADRGVAAQFERWGARPGMLLQGDLAPSTARVALAASPDDILARMRRSTRGNIRRGLSRGLVARRGDGADLPKLLHLLEVAAQRRGTSPPSRTRYRHLWDALHPHGLAHLFLVEQAGVPVSAQLAIRFGDTLYSHLMGWSGTHAQRKPNELLEWTAMLWARDHGCRYYDFEGVDRPGGDGGSEPRAATPSSAVAAARDDAPASPARDHWVSDYKLGFGAEVVGLPGYHERVFHPVLRWGYERAVPAVTALPGSGRMEERLRRVVAGRAR